MRIKLLPLITLVLIFIIECPAVCQMKDTVNISLKEVLFIAHKNSLDAVRAKNLYLASYWEYRSYQSGLLPQANLRIEPFSFNRIMTKRYDSEENIEVFREQQTLNSYANLQIGQNIGLTGGQIYIDTDLSRLVNFSQNKNLTTYSATPVRIGISQPLFAFNQTKWLHKIAPLKMEIAKKEFVQQQQTINVQAIQLYFELLLAYINKDIAENNIRITTDLFNIGKKRFDIITVDQKALLDLELNRYNAEIELAKANKNIQRASFNLNSFLRQDKNTEYLPRAPEIPKGLTIDVNEAITNAFAFNPDLLKFKQQGLETEMNLDQTIRENRFNVSLNASYGLNQQSENFDEIYSNLLDQEVVGVYMNVPLLDWGERRGRKEMALRRKEASDIEIQQATMNFEQEVTLKVIDFNLQEKLVYSAFKADSIANASFSLTQKRFKSGKSDVLELTSAMQNQQQAKQNYISNLFTYWTYFYEVQQLTLYDFVNNEALKNEYEDFFNSN